MLPKATILARGYFSLSWAKTAHGLIRHGRKYKIISVIDETLVGQDAGEVIGIGHKDIPIIDNVDLNADVLIIGVAPSGGRLPAKWREDIITAIKNGIDIVSGLHEFLNNDRELATLAKVHKVKLIDVRKPPTKLHIAKRIKPSAPVILLCGTDAACGKRTTALELYNAALGRGINAGFIATGQTGILIGCDAGVAVDHIPTDFVAGEVERMVQEVIDQGKELIFIEGQGAILHHAYSTSTIGILHGAQPQYIILVHPPLRKHRSSFPEIPVPSPKQEIQALEQLLPGTKVIGLSLNTKGAKDYLKICKKFEKSTKLPTVDVLADPKGADKLLDKILTQIDKKGKKK
jgi:uncharacterized NAD-dependent epimerase/dehydratase family protein